MRIPILLFIADTPFWFGYSSQTGLEFCRFAAMVAVDEAVVKLFVLFMLSRNLGHVD